jgi:tRNA(His) 5'-end guanylyltransferase
MSKTKLYESIISKAFKDHLMPFTPGDEASFLWSGSTKVKRKSTGKMYDVNVAIQLSASKRLQKDIATCLCRPEGVRFDDLRIVALLDSKLDGEISITGLPAPSQKVTVPFKKFIQEVEKQVTES